MITMEMIDEFRKRTGCSYQEAKLFLERNNGDLVEAVVDYERVHNKIKNDKKSTAGDFFKKANQTKFVIEHNGSTVLNLSVLVLGILVLLTLPVFPVILVSLLVALLLGCKISIKKHTGAEVRINEIVSSITDTRNQEGQ